MGKDVYAQLVRQEDVRESESGYRKRPVDSQPGQLIDSVLIKICTPCHNRTRMHVYVRQFQREPRAFRRVPSRMSPSLKWESRQQTRGKRGKHRDLQYSDNNAYLDNDKGCRAVCGGVRHCLQREYCSDIF